MTNDLEHEYQGKTSEDLRYMLQELDDQVRAYHYGHYHALHTNKRRGLLLELERRRAGQLSRLGGTWA